MLDITGLVFGRWTVQEFARKNGPDYFWRCVCVCGNLKDVRGDALKSGKSISCGCHRKEYLSVIRATHGQNRTNESRTGAYASWCAMKQRCQDPAARNYKDYGGRGISVCDRWQSFENFYADMGDRPNGKSLDRYPDVDGNYEPGNVRWATAKEQRANQRKRFNNDAAELRQS